jgi:putative transposase
LGGGVAHVLSRGNNRARVFHSPHEYDSFVKLLDEARLEYNVDLYAFSIMPNHFHLVVRVDEVAQLSGMMQMWLTKHATRYHLTHGSCGHVWQARFKSFPIQADGHLLTVLRYVLLNPCRASLVQHPWEWRWSSLRNGWMIKSWPVEPGMPISAWLKDSDSAERLELLRRSLRRGAPFGDEAWREETARVLGIESTLRRRGRPWPAKAPTVHPGPATTEFQF